MVATRRQSGKLPPPLTAPSTGGNVETSDEEDPFAGYESSTDESDSSDDDFAVKRSGRKGRPAAKRAKTSDTSSKTTTKSKNKGKDLSRIIDMPLDVLFEIFGCLSPNDLLNLTRTNKMLRATLMSKQAKTVWNAALKGRNAPQCPEDFSEPRWAYLLFGGNVCHTCGARGIQRVDFGLRRRVCSSCLKDNLVVASKFGTRFPDYDPIVLDLLPYTNTGGWAHGYASKSKFYWVDDIYAMVKELGKYQKDVKLRKRGAKQALDDFKSSRIEFVAANFAKARKCYNWAPAYAQILENEKQKRIDQRYEAIKARLLLLGHLQVDILRSLRDCSAVNKDAELTDRSWSRIRATVEADVNKEKVERIARERKSVIDSRKQVVKDVYLAYKKELVPTQWAYHPKDDQVYNFEGIAALINDPSASNIEPSHYRETLEKLPSLIEVFNEEKRALLLSLVTRKENFNDINNDIAGKTGRTCLDLATSVFQCSAVGCQLQKRPLIAWQRAICHSCDVQRGQGYGYHYGLYSRRDTLTPAFTFSDRGSTAVESLAVFLALDARAAVPADYDGKAARFVCLDCNLSSRAGVHGREALTWRDCVAHFIDARYSKNHDSPNWKLLTHDETVVIKRREESQRDPADSDEAWCCNRCPTYFDNFARREPVIQHLKNIHGNTSPSEGVDFFYDQQRGRTPRVPVLFGNKAPHRCLHCGGSREFMLQGVTDHLKAKHKITDPVIGRDMQKI